MSDFDNYDEFLDLGDDFDGEDPFNSSDDNADESETEKVDLASTKESSDESRVLSEEPDEENVDEETPAKQPVQFPKKQESLSSEKSEATNPMLAAAQKAEDKEIELSAASIFALPPVFNYASVNEDITEDLTFEELRIDKSSDFPELEDPKKVEWTVDYGKISKKVIKPGETNILKLKAEIEMSKEFLDSLKKSKDKLPRCNVKPRIIAQTKGVKPLVSYKGIFTSQEEAEKSNKIIKLFPSSNGIMFEQRTNAMGVFTTPAKNIAEISDVSAGFVPALPRIPFSVLSQVIAFFRHFMNDENEFEALVHIFWDMELCEYQIVVPPQYVSKARINTDLSAEAALDDSRYIHYADIHSHNSMKAEFSFLDDQDERATRLYIVIGRLNNYFPEINCRISNGGTFWHVKNSVVLDGLPKLFPKHWTEYVFTDKWHDFCELKELTQYAI